MVETEHILHVEKAALAGDAIRRGWRRLNAALAAPV
jgi:hypothetical protein